MYRAHVLICGGTGCTSSGSVAIQETLAKQLKEKGLEEEVKKHNDKSLKPYQLSVSMGTFLFPYTKDADIKELLESADKQMYKIKENHRAGRRRGDFIARDGVKD